MMGTEEIPMIDMAARNRSTNRLQPKERMKEKQRSCLRIHSPQKRKG
jgi:hypothetical protein